MIFLPFVLITFLLITIIYYLYTIQYSYKNYPPGPFTLPLIGNALQTFMVYPHLNIFKIKPWLVVDKLSRKYGDAYSLKFGPYYGVMLCSYEAMHEVLKLDEWNSKVSNTLTRIRSWDKELGLIFASKPEIWEEMRKFSQKSLRDFGFGKRYTMQSVIEIEIVDIIKETKLLVKQNNGIVKINTNFTLSIINVLWCMLAGIRYNHNDPRLQKLVTKNFLESKNQTFVDPINMIIPSFKHLLPKIFHHHLRVKFYEDFHMFTKELIDERRKSGIYMTAPENYIDAFLKKMLETKHEADTVYTEEQLQIMILDFFQVGTSTTSGTLVYGILFMLLNPQIQAKVQKEIDALIPRHLIPTVDYIEQMPYTMATLSEIHRLAGVVPNPIPRVISSDCTYRGWTIPKGTHVLSNHYSVMMDKNYWKDPFVFRPDRFINEQGQFVPDKRCVQFGFGKRYCIGVTLVNSVFPIYFTTLLQNFTFSQVPGTEPPSTDPQLGVSLSPYEFSTLLTVR